MKYGQFIIGALVGAVGMHILHKMGYMSNKPKPTETLVTEAIEEEKAKYSNPLKKNYDIKMPSDLISKKLKQKGKDFTRARYEVDLMKVKEPVNI
jgi:hypothetical protein